VVGAKPTIFNKTRERFTQTEPYVLGINNKFLSNSTLWRKYEPDLDERTKRRTTNKLLIAVNDNVAGGEHRFSKQNVKNFCKQSVSIEIGNITEAL